MLPVIWAKIDPTNARRPQLIVFSERLSDPLRRRGIHRSKRNKHLFKDLSLVLSVQSNHFDWITNDCWTMSELALEGDIIKASMLTCTSACAREHVDSVGDSSPHNRRGKSGFL